MAGYRLGRKGCGGMYATERRMTLAIMALSKGVRKGKALSRHSGVQRFALLRSGHNSTGRFEKKWHIYFKGFATSSASNSATHWKHSIVRNWHALANVRRCP